MVTIQLPKKPNIDPVHLGKESLERQKTASFFSIIRHEVKRVLPLLKGLGTYTIIPRKRAAIVF
jgi:hypothetical protein